MKKRKYKWGRFFYIPLILSAAVCVHGIKPQNINAAEVNEMNHDYHMLSYKDKTYSYNEQITAVLCAGIDSEDKLVTRNRFTIAPRADSIELVVLDQYHKKVSIIAVSRDTITSVNRYTMNGSYRDNYDTQIGYAYVYGDGGKVSCQNLVSSVSFLLGNIPIQEYVITDNSSITQLNEMAGGITVTVPNNDLSEKHPELTKGSVVKLDHSNVEDFVRWRDINIPFSNNGRMERQQSFISSFLSVFKDRIASDTEGIWREIEDMSDFMQTSITRNQYLTLAGYLEEDDFSPEDYYYISGEDVQGEEHDKVFADETLKMETVIDLFYLEEK